MSDPLQLKPDSVEVRPRFTDPDAVIASIPPPMPPSSMLQTGLAVLWANKMPICLVVLCVIMIFVISIYIYRNWTSTPPPVVAPPPAATPPEPSPGAEVPPQTEEPQPEPSRAEQDKARREYMLALSKARVAATATRIMAARSTGVAPDDAAPQDAPATREYLPTESHHVVVEDEEAHAVSPQPNESEHETAPAAQRPAAPEPMLFADIPAAFIITDSIGPESSAAPYLPTHGPSAKVCASLSSADE